MVFDKNHSKWHFHQHFFKKEGPIIMMRVEKENQGRETKDRKKEEPCVSSPHTACRYIIYFVYIYIKLEPLISIFFEKCISGGSPV